MKPLLTPLRQVATPLYSLKQIKFAINLIAACAYFIRRKLIFWLKFGLIFSVAALYGCATPQAPGAKAVYDFGAAMATPAASATAQRAALILGDIESSAALEGTALLYRLTYAEAQQLRPYTLARWSMPPAQLLRLRLRDALSSRGPVLGSADTATGWLLKVELDEFSQWVDAPAASAGVVRLQATLLRQGQLVAQRSFSARQAAPSTDAVGAVRALTAASDDAVAQINTWVSAHVRAP